MKRVLGTPGAAGMGSDLDAAIGEWTVSKSVPTCWQYDVLLSISCLVCLTTFDQQFYNIYYWISKKISTPLEEKLQSQQSESIHF